MGDRMCRPSDPLRGNGGRTIFNSCVRCNVFASIHYSSTWSPRVIISDRGRQIFSDAVEELLRLCSSQFRHSTPYHPQTNGLVERTNRTLTNMLAMYVSSDHKDWDDVLPFITYAYNTAKHETTDYSPFYLLYARSPLSCIDTILPFDFHSEYSVAKTLCLAEEARRIARLRTVASQHRSKERYDSRHQSVS